MSLMAQIWSLTNFLKIDISQPNLEKPYFSPYGHTITKRYIIWPTYLARQARQFLQQVGNQSPIKMSYVRGLGRQRPQRDASLKMGSLGWKIRITIASTGTCTLYIQLRKNPRVISLYMKQKLFSMSQESTLTTWQPDNFTEMVETL